MKVLLSVPCEHWIHHQVVLRAIMILQDTRHKTRLIMPARRPYENNLNHIAAEMLQDGYDYWINIDSDNPPRNNPVDLIDLDKPLIGLPTPVWHYKDGQKGRPYYFNGYDYVPENDAYKEHIPYDGLQKVDAIGSGCFVMQRKILEMIPAPFERSRYENGTVHKGVDLYFCEKVRNAGFDIYCHYGYPCRHFVEIDVMDIAIHFAEKYSAV